MAFKQEVPKNVEVNGGIAIIKKSESQQELHAILRKLSSDIKEVYIGRKIHFRRHTNPDGSLGGFIEQKTKWLDSPTSYVSYVDPKAYIASSAIIGKHTIIEEGAAKILGNSYITNVHITGNVELTDVTIPLIHLYSEGRIKLSGDMKINGGTLSGEEVSGG